MLKDCLQIVPGELKGIFEYTETNPLILQHSQYLKSLYRLFCSQDEAKDRANSLLALHVDASAMQIDKLLA